MIVATNWLTKMYPYYWYYTYSAAGKVSSARLFTKESPARISELTITVVDRRAEYYEKVLMGM